MTSPQGPVIGTPIAATFQFQAVGHKAPKHISSDTQELLAIQRDLFRTILIAAVAIAAEFSIYWRFFR
jgi:hypothetical protein